MKAGSLCELSLKPVVSGSHQHHTCNMHGHTHRYSAVHTHGYPSTETDRETHRHQGYLETGTCPPSCCGARARLFLSLPLRSEFDC